MTTQVLQAWKQAGRRLAGSVLLQDSNKFAEAYYIQAKASTLHFFNPTLKGLGFRVQALTKP